MTPAGRSGHATNVHCTNIPNRSTAFYFSHVTLPLFFFSSISFFHSAWPRPGHPRTSLSCSCPADGMRAPAGWSFSAPVCNTSQKPCSDVPDTSSNRRGFVGPGSPTVHPRLGAVGRCDDDLYRRFATSPSHQIAKDLPAPPGCTGGPVNSATADVNSGTAGNAPPSDSS